MKSLTRKTLFYYWQHLRKYSFLVTISFLIMFFNVVTEMVIPYFYKLFFDGLAESMSPTQDFDSLFYLIIGVFALQVLSLFFRRAGDAINILVDSKVMQNLYVASFNYLHLHSYRFFTNHFAGSLVKKVNRFIYSFEAIIDRVYYDLFPLVLRILFTLGILLWFHFWVGLVLLVWTLFFLMGNYWFIHFKWKYDVAKADADTKNTALLADTITNNINIKYFASLNSETSRFLKVVSSWRLKLAKVWTLHLWHELAQGLSMILLQFAVFYIALDLWRQDLFTVGDFVWVQAYLIDLFLRLWDFGRKIRDIYVALADAEEMTEILNQKHEIKDLKKATPLLVNRGKIEFKNLTFAYHKSEKVIDQLNLRIKPSEKIALVGHSGGGKSTLTKLILRLVDYQKGELLIDNQSVKKVTQNSLRSQISFVPQDPILFHRTLLENIQYGQPNTSKKEVIAASKLAHCHDFIHQFPKGYQTLVGERGVKLSGGERQRIAIARAILKNAPILILDEATSSLDSYSESLIQKALENLMKHKTTIVIAHRLSTIMKMDRILVLEKGQIIEKGSHKELILQKNSFYRKLWDMQSGGYL